MKILHSADWHIGSHKGPVENGVNLRGVDTIKCLEFLVSKAQEVKPDLVCVSGDIFHVEEIGSSRYSKEMVNATKIIDELAEISKNVIIMRGTPNHDGEGQFQVLKEMLRYTDNTVVITEPCVISLQDADVVCVPGFNKGDFRSRFSGLSANEENEVWSNEISNIITGLRAQCTIDKKAILMSHYTVPGCNMESGQTAFYTKFEPVIPREALLAANYDLVLLGHIHRPQQLAGLNNVFYSGAINALTFNDEGQERGFYIHDTELDTHEFIETPYRKFHTIQWCEEDVIAYLQQGKLALIGEADRIKDKIIRVLYSCNTEQKKALNIAVLQNDLYDMGAFFVADIEPEKLFELANRDILSEQSDPLINLKQWLEEKNYKNPDKIVELAEPIIAAAIKRDSTAKLHGIFKPVSIAVENYRNYKEESFNFEDISFCTINGQNGAGKSSLFMDAIIDCLFEKPREGTVDGWIRGTDDAKKGSIEFVFDVGDTRYRVVRTRTKAGRPTLNLSQYDENGEWLNLSKENHRETQAEIIRLLGMDEQIFKSCALIMQDNYGVFLEAKSDERMAVLGNLLGLGIYDYMESEAKGYQISTRRKLDSMKEAVKIKEELIKAKGDPNSELEELERDIEQLTTQKEALDKEFKTARSYMDGYESAKERRNVLQNTLTSLNAQKYEIAKNINTVQQTISECNDKLQTEDVIRQKAAEYEVVVGQIAELDTVKVKYDNAQHQLNELNEQTGRYNAELAQAKENKIKIDTQLVQSISADVEDIELKLSELESARTLMESIRIKKDKHSELFRELRLTHAEGVSEVNERRSYLNSQLADLKACNQQKEYMETSGCLDIANANCRFLDKAKTDVARIEEIKISIEKTMESISALETQYQEKEARLEEQMKEVGYEPNAEQAVVAKITELEKYQAMKQEAERQKVLCARLEAEKESNDKIIASNTERIAMVTSKVQAANAELSKLEEKLNDYESLKNSALTLKIYVEQLKQLPVYIERKNHAEERLEELKQSSEENMNQILKVDADLENVDKELKEYGADIEIKIADLQTRIGKNAEALTECQINKGALAQRIEDLENLESEVKILNVEVIAVAARLDRYDALKQAFSKDGVPHQIVRNIIPHIEETANGILGSMTGGTMGVEFELEKENKNGDKAILEVKINEYGKTKLPYTSKSGGEKVKASLAVILALSEIKASAAGIQFGMLFIDEPPFLDGDGVQAYVDSLEAIRERYQDIKLMAITHDVEMKARFMQSVTVMKTDEGSKVVY